MLALDGNVTNKQADEITQLYLDLEEYDKKPLAFLPKFKKAKKLQGVEANTASWVTNIGNEKGEVLNSTTGVSTVRCNMRWTIQIESLMVRFLFLTTRFLVHTQVGRLTTCGSLIPCITPTSILTTSENIISQIFNR